MRKVISFLSRLKEESVIREAAEWLAVLSFSFIIILRVYAAYMTQPVLTYDDKHYRGVARYYANHLGYDKIARNLLLPNSDSIGSRSIGYNSWLAAGYKFLGFMDEERRFQTVNLFLYLLQGMLVLLFAWWASREWWFAFGAGFLYLSMPISFGMNRWIMTENLVLAALVVFPVVAVWMTSLSFTWIKQPYRTIVGEILFPAAGAYTIALFCGLREYALPTLIVIVAGMVMALVVSGRWMALAVFLAVFIPFGIATYKGDIGLIYETIGKTGIVKENMDGNVLKFKAPFLPWAGKTITNSYGPAMSVFMSLGILSLIAGAFGMGREKLSSGRKGFKDIAIGIFKPVNMLLLCQIVLFAAYAYIVCVAKYKDYRTTILPGVTLFILILTYVRVSGGMGAVKNVIKIQRFMICLLLLSWAVLLYQLFVPFEGGKTFFIRPHSLPTYNHPLHLRELSGMRDWHVVDKDE